MNIPLVDLAWQHREVADEVARGTATVLERAAFIGGSEVAAFEDEYTAFLGGGSCVGVGNGTDAVEIALRAVGVGYGDDVLVPANTFIATATAVIRAGARPVLVDCDDRHLLMDPELVASALTPATRAVIPVHLYGQAAPVEQIRDALSGSGIHLVEDAAQSQGARRLGVACGLLGDVAATSFYPGKNLGAYGDAGAVISCDAAMAERARLLGNHGSPAKYEHSTLGFNSRLDTLQAVVLRAKLARLGEWNRLRQQAAERYAALLGDVAGLRLPEVMPGNEHVWHLYVVRVADRDRVLQRLNDAGIGAGIHYPVPVHRHRALAGVIDPRASFPVAEAAARDMLSLPLFPGITREQQERVADVLRDAILADAA